MWTHDLEVVVYHAFAMVYSCYVSIGLYRFISASSRDLEVIIVEGQHQEQPEPRREEAPEALGREGAPEVLPGL